MELQEPRVRDSKSMSSLLEMGKEKEAGTSMKKSTRRLEASRDWKETMTYMVP
jgi:hypothetical protein